MRIALAAVLRRLANRLMPQPCIHQVHVTLDGKDITTYLDGRFIHRTLLDLKRRNGGNGLGLG